MTVRAGIIGSSGGSALAAAVECLRSAGLAVELHVVTDRDCGLARWAKAQRFPCAQVEYKNAAAFSATCAKVFQDADVGDVLLFYTRIVAEPLISQFRVCNIHPSLLPEFAGLHGVRQAWESRSPSLGATLHHVDRTLDTGRHIAQVSSALPTDLSLHDAERISYRQKVYLTLLWYERLAAGTTFSKDANAAANVSEAIDWAGDTLRSPELLRCYRAWANDSLVDENVVQSAVS